MHLDSLRPRKGADFYPQNDIRLQLFLVQTHFQIIVILMVDNNHPQHSPSTGQNGKFDNQLTAGEEPGKFGGNVAHRFRPKDTVFDDQSRRHAPSAGNKRHSGWHKGRPAFLPLLLQQGLTSRLHAWRVYRS